MEAGMLDQGRGLLGWVMGVCCRAACPQDDFRNPYNLCSAGSLTPEWISMAGLLGWFAQLLMEEYNLPKSDRRDAMFLKVELESMHAALLKVAQMPRDQLDVQVRIWFADIRELSYDMEDAVDCIMVRSEPSFGKITVLDSLGPSVV